MMLKCVAKYPCSGLMREREKLLIHVHTLYEAVGLRGKEKCILVNINE